MADARTLFNAAVADRQLAELHAMLTPARGSHEPEPPTRAAVEAMRRMLASASLMPVGGGIWLHLGWNGDDEIAVEINEYGKVVRDD